jgi:predicted Rossmann-fold nucleotide-binding protein
MPGGYGTLDEFFEAITLIQTGKFQKFPVVLMGKEYHKDLYNHIHSMVKNKTISDIDTDLFLYTDSIEEAMTHLNKYGVEGFKLKKRKRIRPSGILGEK